MHIPYIKPLCDSIIMLAMRTLRRLRNALANILQLLRGVGYVYHSKYTDRCPFLNTAINVAIVHYCGTHVTFPIKLCSDSCNYNPPYFRCSSEIQSLPGAFMFSRNISSWTFFYSFKGSSDNISKLQYGIRVI